MFGLVRHVGSVALADDGVPGGAELVVERALHVARHVLLDGELFQRVVGDLDGLRLHVLGHVDVLDDGLEVAHVGCGVRTGGTSERGSSFRRHVARSCWEREGESERQDQHLPRKPRSVHAQNGSGFARGEVGSNS